MNYSIFLPFSALAIWLLAIYAENKFRYIYEDKNAACAAKKTNGLRRFIILRNRSLKYIGLFMLWIGFNTGAVLSDGNYSSISIFAYSFGLLGTIFYVVSRLWPFMSD